MSEDQITQAAVDETKAPAVPGAEVTSAQDGDDLDTLLKQFDEENKTSSETAKPETRAEAADENKVANETVLKEAQFIRSERTKKDIEATVKDIRGDLPSEYFDDHLVEAWLDAQAMKNPALGQAWAKRHDNPQQFAKVKAALGREFAKKYGKFPDAQATEDREAVAAAVRGSSTRAPEGKGPDYSKMSQRELDKEWEKFGA